jgi:cytochrome oxidase Cu insertion factor (SCO1/SenC/PrrC family)
MPRAALPLALLALLLAACQSAPAPTGTGAPAAAMLAANNAAAEPRVLRVGDRAPDFTLQDQHRQDVSLSQFRGRPVQIAFYVWAFSPG